MRKIVNSVFMVLFLIGAMACHGQNSKPEASAPKVETSVQVYYFHFTRRCATCNAVEAESRTALTNLYPEQMKSGAVKFTSINLDDEASKKLAQECKAAGQALLVIGGGKRIDLTNQGFMYALGNPDRLMQEIKKAVDPLL